MTGNCVNHLEERGRPPHRPLRRPLPVPRLRRRVARRRRPRADILVLQHSPLALPPKEKLRPQRLVVFPYLGKRPVVVRVENRAVAAAAAAGADATAGAARVCRVSICCTLSGGSGRGRSLGRGDSARQVLA